MTTITVATHHELTKKQLMDAVKECKGMLNELGLRVPYGIQYRVSRRMTRSLGNYHERSRIDRFGERTVISRTISISADLPIEIAKDTIMHELLHAVAGVKAGHGREWKRYAKMVNDTYKMHITTYATDEEARVITATRLAKRNARKIGITGGTIHVYPL